MRHWSERLWPLVVAVLFGAGFLYGQPRLEGVGKLLEGLLAAALSVSATMMGFLLTITTILNAIGTRRMRFVRDSPKTYTLLLWYLKVAIWLNIAVVSLALALPFVSVAIGDLPRYGLAMQVFEVGLITWAWCASIRFTVTFIHLLGGGD